MKQLKYALGASLAGCLVAATLGAAAPGNGATATYAVTITNLTRNQVFSPALVATHREEGALFRAGQPASDGLALLAEEGDNSVLMTELLMRGAAADVQSGAGVIPPGQSETIHVSTFAGNRLLSMASMLVNTNDAFVAVESIPLPSRESNHRAIAYDAGSEYNSESCDFVPGPACGAAGAHDPREAEGFVYVHNGIHGFADLSPEQYDWRNPVAHVSVKRVMP